MTTGRGLNTLAYIGCKDDLAKDLRNVTYKYTLTDNQLTARPSPTGRRVLIGKPAIILGSRNNR